MKIDSEILKEINSISNHLQKISGEISQFKEKGIWDFLNIGLPAIVAIIAVVLTYVLTRRSQKIEERNRHIKEYISAIKLYKLRLNEIINHFASLNYLMQRLLGSSSTFTPINISQNWSNIPPLLGQWHSQISSSSFTVNHISGQPFNFLQQQCITNIEKVIYDPQYFNHSLSEMDSSVNAVLEYLPKDIQEEYQKFVNSLATISSNQYANFNIKCTYSELDTYVKNAMARIS